MPTEKSPLLRTTANGEQDTANGSYGHSAYSAFSDDQFLVDIDKRAELATPECGLSTVEASRRLKTYGRNEKALPEISSTRRLIAQLSHPLALLGWVVVAMELLSLRMTNALAVTTLLLMQAIPRWIQRVKAAKALAVLRATVKSEALVIRDGVHQTIDASLLVLGDRITLGAGAVVPADCRICVGGGIEVDISKLAGESFPVVLSVGDDAKQGWWFSVVKWTPSSQRLARRRSSRARPRWQSITHPRHTSKRQCLPSLCNFFSQQLVWPSR
ncbi:hypothetical protein PINS_up015656 [Pythium insidiosum]|nr:hypothetical protein PINS_up015656 [Pythium insidiosum]